MQNFLFAISCFVCLACTVCGQTVEKPPLRVVVAGLSHDHVHAVLRRHLRGDLQIVGIAESNRELAKRHADRYGFKIDLVSNSLADLLEKTEPEVVCDYGSIYGHLNTVQICAPRGVDVMVEKPLAVSLEHVRVMERLAAKHGINLITNYETTWYASHLAAKRLLTEAATLGEIRKIVVHDGHPGPAEIGCSQEFLAWLTDPRLNGGGALTDFGCYGANLSTWFMNGQRPTSVTAVTQQIKPDRYPQVDDEATLVLTYPKAQAIVQASWNWNYNRKDIEIYCQHGFVHCLNSKQMRTMRPPSNEVMGQVAPPISAPHGDPFEYLAEVVRGTIQVKPTDLSSLQNNVTVVEILEAAKISADTSRTVRMDELKAD
ncbi:MAG: Gfo/Idh/MocA family oxidoreductase [Pirellulaceae bacterium]|nr:Gfo/Idh/MocA family oxidoreductase [Pirellulaceae bacterium]